MIFKLPEVVAHCNGFIDGKSGKVVASGHTGFLLVLDSLPVFERNEVTMQVVGVRVRIHNHLKSVPHIF